MLRVRLLGDLEVWRGDAPLPSAAWRTRQTLSVLRLLLHERDRVVSAERLADAIWPDAGFEGARNNLHVAIRTLRGALEPGLTRGGASRYLRTEPPGYRFVAGECAVDVDDFLRLCQAGSAAHGRGESETAVRALREALALYRGDYLADEPYADWAEGARERLRAAYLDATDRLAALLAAGGENAEAIAHVERALAIDPLREALHRRLMTCLAAQGRRGDALAAYERAEALLKEELGVAPSAETRRVREQLLMASGPARPLSNTSVAAANVGIAPELDALALSASETTLHSDRTLPFVGRDRDLAALHGAWALAEREAGHVVVLRGAPGAGKTRLAQRFAERTGARTLWLTAHEAETGLPFAAPAALLSRWLEQPAAASQVRRLGPLAPVLAHLLPQTRRVWPECPPLQQEPQAGQVVETLTQALLSLIGTSRALVVLDDAQWADRSTLLWLSYALRLLPRGTLAVVTQRTGEAAPDELDALIAGLRRAERVTELEVGTLSAADVEALVETRASARESVRGVGRFVHEVTGGHALYVVETLRELRARGVLFADESGGWRVGAGWQDELALRPPVATGVREAIGRRVARLETGAAAALEAMAVLGVPCRAELVAEVAEMGGAAALD
ncbi:MAG TPA: BTAD domain-containing putative transcriptional regulator, partial [Chloroflexota bacterium]|nr:BTAD domain-containing putative transcriptional regulator [Chloroflexota bacterium]